MTVHELNKDQLEELRASYYYLIIDLEKESLKHINTPKEIPIKTIIDYYKEVDFVNDDFFCSVEHTETKFPNGFASWKETHYEIVSMLTLAYERENKNIEEFYDRHGTGGMYELAEEWTFKFEEQTKGREWDGEFFDEIEEFFYNHLTNL